MTDEEFMQKLKEVMLESCGLCKGTGKREVEVYTNLYATQPCDLCDATGKRLSKFARKLFGTRK